MFYAASPALLEHGFISKKHGRTQAEFGKRFVRTGILPVRLHQWLGDSADARIIGDYTGNRHVTCDEAKTHIERSIVFLDEIRKLLASEKT